MRLMLQKRYTLRCRACGYERIVPTNRMAELKAMLPECPACARTTDIDPSAWIKHMQLAGGKPAEIDC